MYKNRVGNDKKKFKIPAFLFCEVRNSAENRLGKNLKYIHKLGSGNNLTDTYLQYLQVIFKV